MNDKVKMTRSWNTFSLIRHENKEQCNFHVSDILKLVQDNYEPNTHTNELRFKGKYLDETLFIQDSCRDSIICFKGSIYADIPKNIYLQTDPVREVGGIKNKPKLIILEDISSKRYETNKY